MFTTPLYPIYQKYGAKLVDFHGWTLPVQFSGIIQEHLTVRKQVGLFDVSHMGEILVEGPEADNFLNHLLTNDISTLKPGLIRYSPMCFENGGTIDDLLVYCFAEDRFMLIVNASNIEPDFNWINKKTAAFKVIAHNLSGETAQMAVQGPQAVNLLDQLADRPVSDLKYYHFKPEVRLANIPVLLSRTGYTGEDGFEIYLRPEQAIILWDIIMNTGQTYGLKPVGLGARDTLRLESGLLLYGNELSPEISPVMAGLTRFVKFEKNDFIGKASLIKQHLEGVARYLTGLEMVERGIPRSGCLIYQNGIAVGVVTSGTYCPYLAKNLALILVAKEINEPGQLVAVEIRGKLIKGKIVKLPFYTRPKGEAK